MSVSALKKPYWSCLGSVSPCSSPASCSRNAVIVSQSLSSDPATPHRLSTRYVACSWSCQESELIALDYLYNLTPLHGCASTSVFLNYNDRHSCYPWRNERFTVESKVGRSFLFSNRQFAATQDYNRRSDHQGATGVTSQHVSEIPAWITWSSCQR